jgi:CelD/BcsL family acetyltransferase involved in cellulose biosynthesis
MTMAAAIGNDLTPARVDAAASRISRVEIISDLVEAEPIWRRLEGASGFSTPYQRFDLIRAWQTNIGMREGWRPFIVAAYDKDQQPVAVMPLVVRRSRGVTLASFPGDKHSTFNMPLWRRDVASLVTRDDIVAMLKLIHAQAPEVDVLTLERQPASWHGLSNPMRLYGGQPSVNECPLLIMNPADPPAARISNSFRRRLKTKERKLAALPGYRYGVATGDAHIRAVLDAFFRIKPQRMAAQKLPNVFDEPGAESFVRDACMPQRDGRPAPIDIHVLECDEEMIAMFAGVADGSRFSMMFNTYTLSENAKYSPGLILMRNIIDHYAERGYTSLDLGIGSDDYKRLFCKDDEPIFDSYLPLTAKGRVAVAVLSSLGHLKRTVKQTPALKRAAQAIRQRLPR